MNPSPPGAGRSTVPGAPYWEHEVTFVVRYRGSTESTKPGSGSVLPGLVLLRAGRWSLRRGMGGADAPRALRGRPAS